MTAIKRYRWDSAEHAEAFGTHLHGYGSREHLYSVPRDLLAYFPAGTTAIDWGVGTGNLRSKTAGQTGGKRLTG
jgi:hypothetical protein